MENANASDQISTRLATVEKASELRVRIQFNAEAIIDAASIAEIMQARKQVFPGNRFTLLVVVPPDAQLAMSIMDRDHYAANPGPERLALAMVATDAMHEMMTGMYYAYFPVPFKTKVFATEAEADKWLTGIEEAAKARG
jgi:hypothetical protein